MTKNILQVRIMLASPSDLTDERKMIDTVIKELNLTWSQTLGVNLEIIDWLTFSYPDVSTDPQAVINSQLPEDYDIFLAMLWSRIGSPTPRAESGTLEEFERAYLKWQKNPKSVHIMIYFKTAPISPDVDVEQLRKVQDFKNILKQRGVLFSSFEKSDDLSQLLRLDLTRQVHEILNQQNMENGKVMTDGTPLTSLKALATNIDAPIPEDEGFLDSIERSVESSKRATEVIRHFTEEMSSMNSKTVQITKELTASTQQSPNNYQEPKRIINRFANIMEDFVTRTSPDILIFEESLSVTLDSYSKVISLFTDFGISEENYSLLENARASLISLRENMGPFRDSIYNLILSVSRLPRATTQFNRSRRRYMEVLESIVTIVDKALQLIPQIEKTADEILLSYKKELKK